MSGFSYVKYEFVYPRSLQVGDAVIINGWTRTITRIDANSIRITVYFMRPKKRGEGQCEDSYTYWLAVGEIRAKKVRA